MNISGNKQKYHTKSPLKRSLIGSFLEKIVSFVEFVEPKNVLDAGCGEGFVISYLRKHLRDSAKENMTISGFDISTENIENAKKIVGEETVSVDDIYKISQADESYELVMALEVLEHLKDPERALKELKRVSSEYVLISVPLEPFFSYGSIVMGKNFSRFSKEKKPVNSWSRRGITKLIEKHFEIEKIRVSFPWTIILAKKKNNKKKQN